ncbi:MAG: Uma2 family endonuclease [Planctomycetes bacterium]|nr:Uma2 family endonuclease [Planctomycetota bacterium]MCB9918981.1 Uma2 family endonuclease [Planctomycetota bacterium]
MPGSTAKLDYTDYLRFPDDGRRHEIIGGEYFVNPAPSTGHQAVSTRLAARLVFAIEDQGLGRVLSAPTDVELTEHDIVQPDIVVLTAEHASRIGPNRIHGPPDLVVEILSPGTRGHDRERKFELYERAGVREYWIVDPEARNVVQYASRGSLLSFVGTPDDRIELEIFPSVTIRLDRVW